MLANAAFSVVKNTLPNEGQIVGIDDGFIFARDAENRKTDWMEAIVDIISSYVLEIQGLASVN